MIDAYLCDAVRTPVGRYGGSLTKVRPDDLSAMVMRELVTRNPGLDPAAIDDVIVGCANQAGEDNRNVARMALLLAGLPESVPGITVNRLCASGLEAIGLAARAIAVGEAEVILAGGVESMSRAPFVVGKAEKAFDRTATIYDTTIGWRFVNPRMHEAHGTDSMIRTAENLVVDYQISRDDQDRFALASQRKVAKAREEGHFADEIMPVVLPVRKGDPITVSSDEHPRETNLEKLASLRPLEAGGTVTAGNASGVNDGAAMTLIATADAARRFGLTPRARILGMAAAGTAPRIMGIGPVPATKKLLGRLGRSLDDFQLIELNEAFAAQALACLSDLKLEPEDPRINPQGGAIAIGHPLGMSGARLVTTAFHQLTRGDGRSLALCTMCVGVGQGVALALERM